MYNIPLNKMAGLVNVLVWFFLVTKPLLIIIFVNHYLYTHLFVLIAHLHFADMLEDISAAN